MIAYKTHLLMEGMGYLKNTRDVRERQEEISPLSFVAIFQMMPFAVLLLIGGVKRVMYLYNSLVNRFLPSRKMVLIGWAEPSKGRRLHLMNEKGRSLLRHRL